MRSNLEFWKEMQEQDYFENHPCYRGLDDHGGDVNFIEKFITLNPKMSAVVIGCGYGRESAYIAKRVGWVYGIDVNETILSKARAWVTERGVHNFTAILADNYKSDIPNEIDLIYSIVVMQHLTKDLVYDYLVS